MRRQLFGPAAILVALAACSANPAPGEAPTRSADVITAAELADPQIAAGDALQAVQRLRPRFLMTRGTMSSANPQAGSVHVSIDGGPLVSVDNLNRLRPASIEEIRYLSPTDAAQRFGTTAAMGGVILVKSK